MGAILVMKLLNIDNYDIRPSEELFLLKPFRELLDKDKSEGKSAFIDFLCLLYYGYDPRSSYGDIFDETARIKKICSDNGIKYKEFTALQTRCIELYKEVTTTTSQKLLDSMRKAVAKIGEFLENVDLNAVDNKGKRVDSVASIVSATDKVPLLAKKLIETEKIVNSEIAEKSRMRGGEEQAHAFEGGF